MKRYFQSIIIICTLVTLTMGCSTTKSTENMLSAAGFKEIPANTPQREAHLQSLPEDKVTRVVVNGTTYYACPDKKDQLLYVGREPEYQEYQRLRLENNMAEEQLQASENNADWGAWGAWGGGWGGGWRR